MNFKRLSAAVLALVMTASLAVTALAEEAPTLEYAPTGEGYHAQLFLNGAELDTAAIPYVEGDLLPMRLLAEADYGSAEWFQEDNQGYFNFGDKSIIVNFADNSVEMDYEVVEGVTATLVEGVTYLPAQFVASIEGVEVDLNLELDVDRIDVTTPNGEPIMKLAREIMAAAEMGMSMKTSAAEMEEFYSEALGFKADFFTESVIFLPMMTTPDTLVLGKVAEGQLDALKESLEGFRQIQEDTFTWYLPDNLPKTQNAKVVTNGDWFLFLMAEKADDAVAVFESGVAALEQPEA